MPTTYHVAKTGLDTNPGTLGSPFLTVAACLNASAADDKIRIHKGVYTDTWPHTKVYGRDIAAYQGEPVTIDCQGTRAYVSSAKIDGSGTTLITIGLRIKGINFVNYTTAAFQTQDSPPGVPPGSLSGKAFDLLDLFFKPATNVGTFSQDFLAQLSPLGAPLRIEGCSFVGHEAGGLGGGNLDIFRHNAFKGNTYSYEAIIGINFEGIGNITASSEKDYNAYPGNTQDAHPINTTTSPFSFTNEGIGDYSLPAGSALRGFGKYGANIGAPFYGRVAVDAEFSDLPLSAGINDILWYNPGLPGPGTEGPVDAGPAVYSAGVFKIDNVTAPGAKSARAKLGPYTVPTGSKIHIPSWLSLEDLTPPSGSRNVVDFTGGTGTRDIQISINGGTKQTVTRATDLNVPATDVTFYVTIRADGV